MKTSLHRDADGAADLGGFKAKLDYPPAHCAGVYMKDTHAVPVCIDWMPVAVWHCVQIATMPVAG